MHFHKLQFAIVEKHAAAKCRQVTSQVALQACACCCLRVAGVRSPAAYAAAAAITPTDLLKQLYGPAIPTGAGAPSAQPPPPPPQQQQQQQQQQQPSLADDFHAPPVQPLLAASAPGEGAVAGHKRRRDEDAQQRSAAEAPGPAAAVLAAAAGTGGAADTAGAVHSAEAPEAAIGALPSSGDRPAASTPSAALCPLCFGTLPAMSLARSAPRSSGAPSTGHPAVALQVLLPPPAWRDPALHFLGLPEEQQGAAASPVAGPQPSQGAEPQGAVGGQEPDSSQPLAEHPQQQRQQEGAPAMAAAAGAIAREAVAESGAAAEAAAAKGAAAAAACADLSAAARLLSAGFEFGGPGPGGAAAGQGPAGQDATTEGFAVELSIPASLAVRAQALWWRLLGALGAHALSAAGIDAQKDIVGEGTCMPAFRVCFVEETETLRRGSKGSLKGSAYR
jgi:hypothetical protein